jgi:hypothetical protein
MSRYFRLHVPTKERGKFNFYEKGYDLVFDRSIMYLLEMMVLLTSKSMVVIQLLYLKMKQTGFSNGWRTGE